MLKNSEQYREQNKILTDLLTSANKQFSQQEDSITKDINEIPFQKMPHTINQNDRIFGFST
jgi:hypothetical protein